jgi:hypothetical protein
MHHGDFQEFSKNSVNFQPAGYVMLYTDTYKTAY